MGSEDLFHKRKARSSAALQRQRRERSRMPRFLIVGEGTTTGPHYWRELRDTLRIRPQMVCIAPNDGSSPNRVVDHALWLYQEDAEGGDAYDKVYCVFDRDRHSTFDAAVQRTKDLSAGGSPLEAITSTPCFEVWLLLHFGYTDQPFHAAGKKSVGDQVVAALKAKPGFAKYGKGQKGLYPQLADKLSDALDHAAQLRQHSTATGSINPSTDIEKLVLAMQAVAKL
mgnify:CR=1 FL=1